MEKKSKEGEPEPVVYEIRGESAVVINGVPKIDPNCSTLVPSNSIKEDDGSRKEKGYGEWLEGWEVRKLFGGKYYHGRVIQFDKETGWYRVEYEDGDSEDLDWVELEEVLFPVDIGVPLKTVALKVLDKNQNDGQLVLPESEIHMDKHVGKKGKKTRTGNSSVENSTRDVNAPLTCALMYLLWTSSTN
ncbi:Dirigent protein 17 [Hibiscus syriacus]|uniref:Dirigent protein 17 n=1 Tax=Hibiscus syriacus TaxID=106335 RepID=A0A6A2XXG5_HIBSY|nr:Dirigent protein 17 [Hibiscus syriacus]